MLATLVLYMSMVTAGWVSGDYFDISCPPNEIYNSCGPSCTPTCQIFYRERYPDVCPDECTAGCFCAPGYIRENVNGTCILNNDCERVCRENEVFRECGTGCPETCRHKDIACPRRCVQGCFCQEGYILDYDTQTCVKEDRCATILK